MSFWNHLDVLRAALIKIAVATITCAVAAFCFKEQLFSIVLAPQSTSFVTYHLIDQVTGLTGGSPVEGVDIRLINTTLAGQFTLHMRVALWAGVVCAFPYILYQLFRFVSPALYADERRYVLRCVVCGYLMFFLGVALSYFLIFPLTFRFLGTYQVSPGVHNLISLQSYISTLLMLSLSLGVVFEMPMLAWLLGRLGVLRASMMRRYRRSAFVLILIVAAIITPTSDVFTLLLVSFPMWLLFELSIAVVSLSAGRTRTNDSLAPIV